MRCGYTLPNFDVHLTPDGQYLQCSRQDKHQGDHLVLLPDGRHILWEYDDNCDCDEECCEDFCWREATDQEVKKLVKYKP